MPKYIIEREIPGASGLSAADLRSIAQTSCGVLDGMGSQVQWLESFVATDIIYSVYIAPSEQVLRDHAGRSGFPANRVTEVVRMIDPTTAE